MTDAVENSLARRGLLLRQELEVVKAALERSASDEDASRDGEWSKKLRRWRNEIEVSLQNLPNRAEREPLGNRTQRADSRSDGGTLALVPPSSRSRS